MLLLAVVALAVVSAMVIGITAWWIAGRLRNLEAALRREVPPGDLVRIPRHDIVGVDVRTWFMKSATAGHPCLVLRLAGDDELGLFVQDTRGWVSALGRDE